MKTVWAVCRLIVLAVWLLLWVILLPFLVAFWAARLVIVRFAFRIQLQRSGVPEEFARRMAKRYTINLSDIVKLAKAYSGS